MKNIGLIGTKIGMSREFFPIGISVPVTVIKIEKGRVIDLITKDKRGYDAIKVGFGKIKTSKLTKSMKGFYSKKSTEPKKYLKEYRVEDISNFKEGNEIGLEIFKDVKFVDVTSKSIGKGFAGVMKRHNFSGLRASLSVAKGLCIAKNLKLFGYDTFIWSCSEFIRQKETIYSLIKFREKYFVKKFNKNLTINFKTKQISTKDIIKKYKASFKVIIKSNIKYFDGKILKLNNINIVDLDHHKLEFLKLRGFLNEGLIKPLYLN